jgi:two-component system, OmpR family, sensor kinase
VSALPPGLALVCRPGGGGPVLRDDAGVVPGGAAPSLQALVAPSGQAGLEALLAQAGRREAGFGCTLPLAQPPGPFEGDWHFYALRQDEGLLVLAGRGAAEVTRITEELVGINNEQTNALRQAFKDLQQAPRRADAQPLLDDFTRLNNELANVQRELVKKNVTLERVSAQKSQLLGIVAHDLRSPLGVILTYSEFLADEAADRLDTEHRQFLAQIQTTSLHLVRLIDDLLDLSQIESGQLRLQVQPVDLAELLRTHAARHAAMAVRKKVDIVLDIAPDLPTLALDPGKMGQVLDNLLDNAVKYSPPGGRVAVTLQATDAQLRLTVADQGAGIHPDDLPRLFEPFSRTRARPTAGESSTGLGLWIVRRIVQGHGGTVGVASTPGQGSRFTVDLPAPVETAGP